MALKIDGRSYSPAVLEKAMYCVSTQPAFHLASNALGKVGGIEISGRHLGNLSEAIGKELCDQRDARTESYFNQMLPRILTDPSTPIHLAAVSVDGGRIQTRTEGGANGVQDPHWRETKNALFMRMSGVAFDDDPHPDLPECFRNRSFMKKLLSGLTEDDPLDEDLDSKSDLRSWRPERLFRTCISSLANSQQFGRMMEAEADSRGFFKAAKQAFVSDGLQYNWTIHARHFPTFTAILDFPHVIEHLHELACALHEDKGQAWQVYVGWVTDCWQGRVSTVIEQLQQEQKLRGTPPEDCSDQDHRKVLAETTTYLQNNASRMNYPQYRREGLPMTSAHMESLVKEIGYRVKGTEKFWNDGRSAEAILQIRAAALCDDDRLERHLRNRPGNPFRPNVKLKPAKSTAA